MKREPKPPHHCDSQAHAGVLIIWIMGTMGMIAIAGLLLLAYTKREPSVAVLTALVGVASATMTGLPSLLARMSNQAEAPKPPEGVQDVSVVNPKSDPIPTLEEKP